MWRHHLVVMENLRQSSLEIDLHVFKSEFIFWEAETRFPLSVNWQATRDRKETRFLNLTYAASLLMEHFLIVGEVLAYFLVVISSHMFNLLRFCRCIVFQLLEFCDQLRFIICSQFETACVNVLHNWGWASWFEPTCKTELVGDSVIQWRFVCGCAVVGIVIYFFAFCTAKILEVCVPNSCTDYRTVRWYHAQWHWDVVC